MRTISIAAAVALQALATAPSMGGEPAALRIGYQKAAAPLVLLRAPGGGRDARAGMMSDDPIGP